MYLIALLALFVTGCDPDEGGDDQPRITTGSLKINMDYVWGDQPLEFNSTYYTTPLGDSFQPTLLKFHINHFKLSGGDKMTEPSNNYGLLNATMDEGQSITLNDLNAGSYESLAFTLGVADSTENYDGKLNEIFISPMFWGMLNGYINVKVEGNSPNVEKDGTVLLHIGGYTPPFALNHPFVFNRNINIEAEKTSEIMLKFDLKQFFTGPNDIDLSEINLIHMPNEDAKKIADNWANMLELVP
jgi:hypothetical protein